MPTTLDDYKRARDFAAEANLRAAEATSELAKERTQYFEKITLAAGTSIALVVSFVGAHAGRLQPPWLLRAALTALFLTMGVAMLRSLRYHTYVHSVHTRQYAVAALERDRSKRDLIEQHPMLDGSTGKLVDVPSYLAKFQKHEEAIEQEISGWQKTENSAFNHMRWLERGAVTLICVGMGMLIVLASLNF
jgi:hypothetical protein